MTAEPERVRQWGQELAGFTGYKIGIAWQGSRSYQEDQFRSIPLAKFEPIARISRTRLFSLQKGYGTEQLAKQRGLKIHDFGKRLDADGAFLDTAAVMMHLDLVITSDTAIAHLAGALGVPVWLALPTAPDWRWLQSVRIVRGIRRCACSGSRGAAIGTPCSRASRASWKRSRRWKMPAATASADWR